MDTFDRHNSLRTTFRVEAFVIACFWVSLGCANGALGDHVAPLGSRMMLTDNGGWGSYCWDAQGVSGEVIQIVKCNPAGTPGQTGWSSPLIPEGQPWIFGAIKLRVPTGTFCVQSAGRGNTLKLAECDSANQAQSFANATGASGYNHYLQQNSGRDCVGIPKDSPDDYQQLVMNDCADSHLFPRNRFELVDANGGGMMPLGSRMMLSDDGGWGNYCWDAQGFSGEVIQIVKCNPAVTPGQTGWSSPLIPEGQPWIFGAIKLRAPTGTFCVQSSGRGNTLELAECDSANQAQSFANATGASGYNHYLQQNSGRDCIGIPKDSPDDYQPLVMNDCADSHLFPRNRFELVDANKYLTVAPLQSSMMPLGSRMMLSDNGGWGNYCWDAQGVSGEVVQIVKCNPAGTPGQTGWSSPLIPQGQPWIFGTIKLRVRADTFCVQSSGRGNILKLAECDSHNQAQSFANATGASGYNHYLQQNSGHDCVGIPEDSPSDHQPLVMNDCANSHLFPRNRFELVDANKYLTAGEGVVIV